VRETAAPWPAEGTCYDGSDALDLARTVAVPRVALFDSVGSTLDVAHELAAQGAPAGTVVLADRQTAGRGRSGRRWSSESGAGIWLTILERPRDAAAVEVLSLRLGLAAARALDRFAPKPVQLKWPNDLYVAGHKLAGILVEARWRDRRPEWLAAGMGVNVAPPQGIAAASLRPGVRRVDVLAALVPALRAAAALAGPLSPGELAAYAERDLARGRRCREPLPGRVQGITSRGELLVATAEGMRAARGGSLVFDDPLQGGEGGP
jgi:BirA family transcriptional regulator, biotin operon repressor / biotin---[acetyl-CoA-carboxylase] ligase